jgi:hypothetical protein
MTTDNILIHPTLKAQVDAELKSFENMLAMVFGIEEMQRFEEFKQKALTDAVVYVDLVNNSQLPMSGPCNQAASDGDKPNGAA